MDGQPMISLRQVSKSFGNVPAVHPMTFDVGRGEFFSLLGPSGCGKTTLLRMIGGFEQPTGGTIFIDGQPMAQVPPHRRPTNMVFQNYAIFPHLSVAENIGYGLLNKPLGKGEREARIRARALVCEPKVLLLDEPLGALDKKLRTDMQIELRRIHREVGITFVLVTHDQEEALTLSDRIAVLEAGRVLQVGDGVDLYEHPRSRAVAAFIGTMNFLDGTVAGSENGHIVVDGPAGRFRANGHSVPVGTPVSLAIRPERISLAWAPPAGAQGLRGTIVGETYLGDRRHYCIKAAGIDEPLWAAAPAFARGGRSIDADVWVSWAEDAALLLDR
jgi:ABC-type Fe3+/spermidine/putrescine transport system ATPase subunit